MLIQTLKQPNPLGGRVKLSPEARQDCLEQIDRLEIQAKELAGKAGRISSGVRDLMRAGTIGSGFATGFGLMYWAAQSGDTVPLFIGLPGVAAGGLAGGIATGLAGLPWVLSGVIKSRESSRCQDEAERIRLQVALNDGTLPSTSEQKLTSSDGSTLHFGVWQDRMHARVFDSAGEVLTEVAAPFSDRGQKLSGWGTDLEGQKHRFSAQRFWLVDDGEFGKLQKLRWTFPSGTKTFYGKLS